MRTFPRATAVATVALVGVSIFSAPAYADDAGQERHSARSSQQVDAEAGIYDSRSGSEVSQLDQEAAAASELEFIFEDATTVTPDGSIEADYPALIDRFGEDGAQNALALVYASQGRTFERAHEGIASEIQTTRTSNANAATKYSAYSDCVLDKSGFASIVSLTNGTLTAYLNDKNWDEAGKLILRAAAKNGLKLTGVGIVATLTAAAGWCAFTT